MEFVIGLRLRLDRFAFVCEFHLWARLTIAVTLAWIPARILIEDIAKVTKGTECGLASTNLLDNLSYVLVTNFGP